MIDLASTLMLFSSVLMACLAFLVFVQSGLAVADGGALQGSESGPRNSLRERAEWWLSEAELDWTLSEVATWFTVAIASVVLVAITLSVPLPYVLVAVLGLTAASLVGLLIRRGLRLQHFRKQMPEVVSIIARATRAGLSVEEGFNLAEQAADGRLKSELNRCASQLTMGRSLSSVLDTLASRTRLREVGLLATILSVHRETGGPLPEALERLSTLLKDQLAYRREMLAATSGGRLSAYLIAPAAPLIFAFLLVTQPDHIAVFFDEPLGRSFLVLGIVLNLIGVLWIYTLMKPQQ